MSVTGTHGLEIVTYVLLAMALLTASLRFRRAALACACAAMFVIAMHFLLTHFINRPGGDSNLALLIYTFGMLATFVSMFLLTAYFLYLELRNRNRR